MIRYHDVGSLLKRIEEEKPKNGDYLFDYKLKEIKQEQDKLDYQEFTRKYKINFKDLPISQNTINGLNKRKFHKLSEIQRCSIPHSLCGRDIMGASKTGSGKTLSYLIPVIERLYTKKWTEWDGLGALIILPTRELAMQVFEVLNSISEYHELSIGLIIGGKNLQYEKQNIHRMNILIATPGRLLQHMEESQGFTSENLQMLVIDEADMLFELGFAETLNAILENIPKLRQTLLFSATLSKNVHQLGKLSLTEPEYIFLHDKSQNQKDQEGDEDNTEGEQKKTKLKDIYETPVKLMQYFMPVNIEEKLNCLFSFLKAHQKTKALVFFSTCKQVRFAFETFKRLKVGLPLMELHGRQKANKRMALFYTFTEKKYGALFTTNLAARGLDFPSVNWVIQVDVPENTETYVHRIGRTARFKQDGKSLMFVTPQEEKFVEKLSNKGINLHKLLQNPQKQLTITSTLQAFCSEDMDIKYLAQRAFISYMKFVHLNGDGQVFDVHKVPIKEFAESIGLVQTPVIKFKKNLSLEDNKNKIEEEQQNKNSDDDSEEEEEDDDEEEKPQKKSKFEKLKEKRMQERLQRQKNKQKKIDIIHMKDEEQEIEQKVYKELQHSKNQNEKYNKLKNRTTKLFDKNNVASEEEDSDDEGEFLTKRKQATVDIDQLEKEVLQKKGNLESLSRNQMKKIKLDGHYGGKNKLKITDDGKYVTQEEQKKQELEDNLKKIQQQEENMDYSLKYALKKDLNQEQDQATHKDRVKEKALKRKQRQWLKEKEKMGEDFEPVLGGEVDEVD